MNKVYFLSKDKTIKFINKLEYDIDKAIYNKTKYIDI